MSFTINAAMIKNLSVDLDTVESVESAGVKAGGRLGSRSNDNVLDTVLLGVVAETHIALTGETASQVAAKYGVAGGTVSKARKLARVARYANTVRGDDSPYDADIEVKIGRLEDWWTREYEGRQVGSLAAHLRDLVAESGEDRPAAIVALVNTFGASNRIDDIMEGRKVHPTLEALQESQGDDGSGDDGSGDDGSTSGLDMIAHAIVVSRAQGHTDAEIAAHVMALLGV